MSCRALIISLQDIVTICNLSDSVLDNQIDSITDLMQIKYIKHILGKELFDELLAQIEAGSLTPENDVLISKIKPALSWLVYSNYIIDANLHSDSAGIIKNVDDNYTLADKEELASISKRAWGNWQVYQNELYMFLKENANDYPLFDVIKCYRKGIAGYSISKVGNNHDNKRKIYVHYPAR